MSVLLNLTACHIFVEKYLMMIYLCVKNLKSIIGARRKLNVDFSILSWASQNVTFHGETKGC